ncbi:MAG TPA: hypothetical protein VNL77_21155 [Roseiflexaceae bacterium]|nr:hypothetical protein [Roseiflexaceae bacterium]
MIFLTACGAVAPSGAGVPLHSTDATPPSSSDGASEPWQEEFHITERQLAPTGESTYFILKPGFQTILESQNERLIVTVLDETREIHGITTRIVEEKEEKRGQLYEISRNFYAIDQRTGDVFYFGEEVDFYENGAIVGHSGAWIAYDNGNLPGMIMPGTPTAGMRYYQELAPGVAMDRATVVSVSERCSTPAGEFTNCLVVEESSKLSPAQREYKRYAPGIGLIQDQSMRLVSYRYLGGADP